MRQAFGRRPAHMPVAGMDVIDADLRHVTVVFEPVSDPEVGERSCSGHRARNVAKGMSPLVSSMSSRICGERPFDRFFEGLPGFVGPSLVVLITSGCSSGSLSVNPGDGRDPGNVDTATWTAAFDGSIPATTEARRSKPRLNREVLASQLDYGQACALVAKHLDELFLAHL